MIHGAFIGMAIILILESKSIGPRVALGFMCISAAAVTALVGA